MKRVQCRPSAEGRAEPAGDSGPQVGLRACGRNVHAAVDQSVDQRPDDFRAVQGAAVLLARRKTIEVQDLAIEQHYRDFGPGFAVDRRAAGAGLAASAWRRRTSSPGSGALLRHQAEPSGQYTRPLLVAQTQL